MHIPSPIGTEKTRDVLDKAPSTGSNKLICDSHELEEQSAAASGESCASAGDADVLAWESSAEDINRKGACVRPPDFASAGATGICRISRRWFDTKSSYIGVAGGSWEALCEDAAPPCVSLTLPRHGVTGLLESEVEAADT